jgi:hypothetical protein
MSHRIVPRGIAGIGAPTIAQQQAAAAAASPALASPQSVLIEADPRVFTRGDLKPKRVLPIGPGVFVFRRRDVEKLAAKRSA